MKKKTKKVALGIGITVLALGAVGVTVGILQHQGKAPLDYVQAVKIENMWKFAQNDVIAELRDYVTVAKDGKITVSEDLTGPNQDLVAQISLLSSKTYNPKGKNNLYVTMNGNAAVANMQNYPLAAAEMIGQYNPVYLLNDGDWSFILANDLEEITDRKGNFEFREGIRHEATPFMTRTEANLALNIVGGGEYSQIGVYDLSPLGFADSEKCNYIFEHLTEGKTFGGDFIFNKGSVSKLAREFDAKMAEEADKSSKGPRPAPASI